MCSLLHRSNLSNLANVRQHVQMIFNNHFVAQTVAECLDFCNAQPAFPYERLNVRPRERSKSPDIRSAGVRVTVRCAAGSMGSGMRVPILYVRVTVLSAGGSMGSILMKFAWNFETFQNKL